MLSTRRLIAFALTLALSLLVAGGLANAALAPVTVRGASQVSLAFSREPVLATSATNLTTVAFTQRSSKQPGIYFSDLRFGAWSRATLIPGSIDGEVPAIAMAPNGATIVAWEQQHGGVRGGLIGVSYRAPGSRVFSKAIYLSTNSNSSTNDEIALAINDAGRAAVSWRHFESTNSSVQAAIVTKGKAASAGTISADASGPSVAIDAAGNAILLYGAAGATVQQSIARAGGGFGAPTTIDADGPGEGNVDNNLRVRANPNGQVVAGWEDHCPDDPNDDCVNIFFARMALGTTTAGITMSQRVSNPYVAADAMTGPSRKAGGATEVAIDAAGNVAMVFETTDSSFEGVDIWSATSAAGSGVIGTSTKIATVASVSAHEIKVAEADGRILAAWSVAESTSQPNVVYLSQAEAPAASVGAAWSAAVAVSPRADDGDTIDLAASPGGTATVAYRAAGDDIKVNTNAARDTTKPTTLRVPANGSMPMVRMGSFPVKLTCPASEASCEGTITATMRVVGRNGVRTTVAAGSGVFAMPGSLTTTASVRLTRAAYLKVTTAHQLDVLLTIKARDAAGNAFTVKRTLQLRHMPGH